MDDILTRSHYCFSNVSSYAYELGWGGGGKGPKAAKSECARTPVRFLIVLVGRTFT